MEVAHLLIILAMALVLTVFISQLMPVQEVPKNDWIIELEPEEKVYHGPVPEGYDLEFFRRTGVTIPLNG
jgi:hypothetical protein